MPACSASFHLLIAGGAVWKVTGGKWLWNIGGIEYCVFWAICCLIVAMHDSAHDAMPLPADSDSRSVGKEYCQ